jgi:rhamnosyltransferase
MLPSRIQVHAMVRIPEPKPDSTCAVIVTYHPDAGFEERLRRIAPQVAHVVVVDNASSPAIRARLEASLGESRLELIGLPENLGIAAALNRGLTRASELGYQWAITFDQDSVADDDLLLRLLEIRAEYPRRDEVAILSANYLEVTTGTTGTPRWPPAQGPWIEVDEVITSGCLLSLAVFGEIGPYREDLFIYFVDNEYCKRARLAGYRVLLASEPLLLHQTGNSVKHQVLGRDIVTPNYAGWRHYYIVRNGIIIAKEYLARDPRWALRRFHSVVRRSAAVLVFEAGRTEKLSYMLKGARDAVLGKTGKLGGGT